MRAGARRSERGFTLLEVLVALAVLAVALSAAVKAAGQNAANATYLRDKTLAQWVAMNKLTELQVAREWPSPGERTGHAEMAGREWRWSTDTQLTEDDRLRRIEVTVRAPSEDSGSIVTVVGFVRLPEED